jgi:hypothetical protein
VTTAAAATGMGFDPNENVLTGCRKSQRFIQFLKSPTPRLIIQVLAFGRKPMF